MQLPEFNTRLQPFNTTACVCGSSRHGRGVTLAAIMLSDVVSYNKAKTTTGTGDGYHPLNRFEGTPVIGVWFTASIPEAATFIRVYQ